MRGGLNITFQLATTIGILVAQCINYGAALTETAGSCSLLRADTVQIDGFHLQDPAIKGSCLQAHEQYGLLQKCFVCCEPGTSYIQPDGWRISLGLAAAPALLLFVGGICLPDTPVSLIQRGKLEKGRQVGTSL